MEFDPGPGGHLRWPSSSCSGISLFSLEFISELSWGKGEGDPVRSSSSSLHAWVRQEAVRKTRGGGRREDRPTEKTKTKESARSTPTGRDDDDLSDRRKLPWLGTGKRKKKWDWVMGMTKWP